MKYVGQNNDIIGIGEIRIDNIANASLPKE